MTPRRAQQKGERPPEAPPHDRSVDVDWRRWVGIPLLFLAPLVLFVGVRGGRWSDALLPVTQVAFIYFFLMIALRVMGKRELSEMSPFELVTLLMVPEIYSSTLGREQFSMTQSTIGVSTLFVLLFLTGLVTFRFKRIETIVEGEPTILVHNGRLMEKNLKRERVTADEVVGEMHKVGIADFDQVRWAILEVDGKISIIPASAPAVLPHDSKKKA